MLLALHFCQEAQNPYFRLCYNSLGAYATVNHLHFQVGHRFRGGTLNIFLQGQPVAEVSLGMNFAGLLSSSTVCGGAGPD